MSLQRCGSKPFNGMLWMAWLDCVFISTVNSMSANITCIFTTSSYLLSVTIFNAEWSPIYGLSVYNKLKQRETCEFVNKIVRW